ncbi:MAG: carboxypeptidase regulatory-like domain-containing protein, partial [Opitutaceae bacterium]
MNSRTQLQFTRKIPPPLLLYILCIFAFLVCVSPAAAQSSLRKFDLPSDAAEKSLKRLSLQSGVEVLFATEMTAGVRTAAVKGEFPVLEAANRALARTGLIAVQDLKTGTLTINRAAPTPLPKKNETGTTQQPMKRNKFLTRLTAAVALILGTQASAQSAQSGPEVAARGGTIEGRVFDAGRGEFLENARVTIEGTSQEKLTEAGGLYRFTEVPAGTVKVKVFFTGLPAQTNPVTVAGGETVQHNVTLSAAGSPSAPMRGAAPGETVQLEKFVVTTSKEMDGAAIAINTQRFARSIINVVAADEFGTVVDGTPGEVMKFLPGITL